MERSKEYYDIEYEQNGRSLHDIAEECGTYPNKIRRELLKLGYKLRNKSTAQSLAIACGRHKHPTKGKKRSEDVKIRISEKVSSSWQAIDETEKARRVDQAKLQWKNMSYEEKEFFKSSGIEAVRQTSKFGSKLEKCLSVGLTEAGYHVEFHRDGLIPNEKLQIDLFLPEIKTAIEIDGPSHFLPIWGEDSLKKTMDADKKKNSLLITNGYVVIRVRSMLKTISEMNKRDLLTITLSAIKDIEDNFPELQDRLVVIELK